MRCSKMMKMRRIKTIVLPASPNYNRNKRRELCGKGCLFMANWMDVLQSSGPIPLNELTLRSSESAEELVRQLEAFKKKGVVIVTGPKSDDLSHLTSEEVAQSADTVVELSWSGLKRSLS
jgi:hypothetical protein